MNETHPDTARLEWLCAHGTRETFDALPDYLAEAREFLDAARGVQPAAKENWWRAAKPDWLKGTALGQDRLGMSAAKEEGQNHAA